MAESYKTPERMGRLAKAIKASRLWLKPYREQTYAAVKEFAGGRWGKMDVPVHVPVPFLSLYITTMRRNLVPKNPRVMLSTFRQQSVPAVSAMQSWCNQEGERMSLGEVFAEWVENALYGLGILKVALSTPADALQSGWRMKSGVPFAEVVDFDDFVVDSHCRRLNRAGFVGHRYRVHKEVLKNMKGARAALKRGEITADDDARINAEGDDRVSAMGRDHNAGENEEYADFVDLWEIYLPEFKRVLTFDSSFIDGVDREPLDDQEWVGPPDGPYHFLTLGGKVMGNPIPKGPVMDILDLHLLGNELFRKMERQGRRQKTVTLVQSTQVEDGTRVTQTPDGHAVAVNNPEATREAVFGGPNQLNAVFFTMVKDLFSYFAGGLDVFAGLGSENPTATQDKIQNQNASRGVTDMQERTVGGVSRAYRALCWYWWHHPELVMRVKENVPGMQDKFIVRQVHPMSGDAPPGANRRQGAFEDLDVRCDPYSLQHRTPMERLGLIRSALQDIIPLAPMLQQQGITPDMREYLKLMAEYADLPELAKMLQVGEPPEVEQASPEGELGPKPQTERRYVRENVSTRNPQEARSQMMQQMTGTNLGGNPNGNGVKRTGGGY